MFQVTDLRTENRREPILIGAGKPVFSWKIGTDEENWFQKSYRILVREESGETVWDSGETESRRQNQIEYAGTALKPDTRYLWQVRIRAEGDPGACGTGESFFETGLSEPSDWRAEWIGENQEEIYHLYRRKFTLAAPVRKAKLYLCALGHGECAVNGRPVTDAVLEPGWTDYRKTIYYTAYDVTELLRQGDNAISVMTGDGMYSVRGGRYVYYPRSFGRRKVLASLRIQYQDGTSAEIPSDARWEEGPSPVRFACIYGGEDDDGSIPWAETSIPDGGSCAEADTAGKPGRSPRSADSGWHPARTVEAPQGELTAQQILPVEVYRRYPAVSVKRIGEDRYIVDFGANFSGRPSLRIRTDGSMAGRRIRLVPGEVLQPDGDVDTRLWHGGYEWNYFCGSAAEQTWTPHFSYTGFRYLRVEGAEIREMPESGQTRADGETASFSPCGDLPAVTEITGEFLCPKLEETGKFTCSDVLWNQIHSLIRQAMLSNIKSYMTDCPTREKFPWLEQTHLIGPALMKNWDLGALYEKEEQDCADSQHEDGLIPDICPEYGTGFDRWHEGFLDSPEWGSAFILNAWFQYQAAGNTRILRKFYPAMAKYAEYLHRKSFHGILHHGLGDWLDIGPTGPYSQNTPRAVTATCIYAQDLSVMAQAARLLGRPEDAERWESLLSETEESFRVLFVDPQSGWIANGSQAAQAMALVCGLVPKETEPMAVRHLRDSVEKRKNAVTAGDVGHPYLVAALHRYGMDDLLAAMADVTDAPGYGYQIRCGATALTEEWDGPDPARPHGSQNHFMLGSLDEWFYTGPGGLPSLRDGSLTGAIRVQPAYVPELSSCHAEEVFPAGRVIVDWRRDEDGTVRLSVAIPPNMEAVIPDESGKARRKVGSGRYQIAVKPENAGAGAGKENKDE
ncbi:MAG: family 78 glycoside hydrolase catalytic domain [Lachnospiraceae bacterium]|jgi:alpha-L-rhamnosidase